MSKFIELRFGQGVPGGGEWENLVQRELVPVDLIKNAFVILPEKRNISISFDDGTGRLFSRTEYYKDEIDCTKRWCMIRKALGITAKSMELNPVPLAMDIEELNEKKGEKENG